MPPVVYTDSTEGVYDSTPKTLTIPTPAKTSVGDALLMIFVESTAQAYTLPDGWTELVQLASGTARVSISRRIATSDEPASHVVAFAANPGLTPAGAILLYRGADPGAALVASGIAAVAASVNYPAPTLNTTALTDILLCGYAAFHDADVFTQAAGMTERVDFSAADASAALNQTALAVADKRPEVVGATGAQQATAAVAANGVAFSVVLASLPPITPETLDPTVQGGFGIWGDLRSMPGIGDPLLP